MIAVALLAASRRYLGGHWVQAETMLRGWAADPDIRVTFAPIDPEPPRPLRPARAVKGLRTLAVSGTFVARLPDVVRRADVVHVFSASFLSFLLAPAPTLVAARALGRPVILNYRGGEAEEHLKRGGRLVRRLLAAADRLVVPSPFLAEVFNRAGLPVTVIPNVIDLDAFSYRERAGFGESPRLLCTRNWQPLYRVADVVQAFGLIRRRWPRARLTLVGEGPEGPRLAALAAETGGDIRLVGRVEHDRIAACYAEADLYLNASSADNQPHSVLEAFAAGLPVVTTDAGGIPHLMTDGVTGRMVPVGDVRQLAAAAEATLADPAAARAMARRARRVVDAHAWSAVAPKWKALYAELAGSARLAR
jgi:glycosyltransferase involved in cell wall biosynthesis